MGFFKNLRAVFDPSVRAEALIETQMDCFKKYMKAYSDRDKNYWLAMTLKSRYPNRDERSYYIETSQFSVLPVVEAPVALGFYLIYKEGGVGAVDPRIEKYSKVIAPVWELMEENRFVGAWLAENPWTAVHQEWLYSALCNFEKSGAISRILSDLDIALNFDADRGCYPQWIK